MLLRDSLANANGFANAVAKNSSSLQKFLANAEWKFATKFASDCECDGLEHSEILLSIAQVVHETVLHMPNQVKMIHRRTLACPWVPLSQNLREAQQTEDRPHTQ